MNEAHEKTRIRQLEDAAAHWEHKYANARQYNRNLEERNQKLEAALRPVANHMVIDKDKEFIGGCYAIDVVQTAKGLVGSVLEPLRATAETSVCKHGNGENCPECATIRAARKRLAMNRSSVK